jgi:hypothetical protein
MSDRENSTTELHAEELGRLIRHLRKKPQSFIETIGGWRREARTDNCLVADYLEAMRAELPKWQYKEENQDE